MNKLRSEIAGEKREAKEIWRRIRKKDFSGNTGLAIKNSIFQFSTTLVSKLGALFFTIILARLLMPELFGLYSLALSTILLFASFSDFGIGGTLVTFVSKALGKKKVKRAKAYMVYLGKIRFFLVTLSIFVLLISARFISETYYQKPLFLALLAGIFYIIFIQISTFFELILQASNYFRGIFYKEILFQTSRLIFVPLAIVLSLKYALTDEKILFFVIAGLSVSYLLSSLLLFVISRKKAPFIQEKKSSLTSKQKRRMNSFLLIISITLLSGIFFSYIDRIMLGRFVLGEFIGYYSAAFGLIGSLSAFAAFSGVLLPIFTRIKAKGLKKGMKKAFRAILAVGILLFLATIIFSAPAINIIYGSEYSQAIGVVRLLSVLIIILPLIGLYSSYFMSKEKPKVIAGLLVLSTIINIILNYVFITSFIKFGQLQAVYGASIATIISQSLYLLSLFIYSRKR